jgi:hypothetical protein
VVLGGTRDVKMGILGSALPACGSQNGAVSIYQTVSSCHSRKPSLPVREHFPVAEDRSIGNSLLRSCSAEYPFEVGCEFLIGGGGLARELLDVLSRKVAVPLAVGLGILDQNIGPPL